jgi:hypothetical protein
MSAGLNHSLPRGGAGFLVASLLLAACGGTSNPPPDPWPKGNIVLQDANNYTSQTTLTIPTIQTASGADLMVCWDGLMKDLLCHNIAAPANGIDNVSFLQIPNMTHDQVAAKLAVGQLDENLVKIYRDYRTAMTPTSTCTKLSSMVLGSSVLMPTMDYVAPAAGKMVSYMLLFATGTTPGVGSRAMTFIEPSATGTATTVAAPDACENNVLHFQATLGAPMTIPATDNTKWHVDWSQITHDSFNNEVAFTKIDNVLLGFYQDKTAADLMAQFKDIDMIATTLYEAPVPAGARDIDLATLKVKGTGAAFPGFTQTNGMWAMAVTCSKCQVPAPILLSILTPQ